MVFAAQARAEYDLTQGDVSVLGGCPFYQASDPFNFNGLLNVVKGQLEAKLAQNEACRAPLQQLQSQLSTIDNYFSTVDPTLKQQAYQAQFQSYLTTLRAALAQLEVKKAQLEASGRTAGDDYVALLSEIATQQGLIQQLEASLNQNEADRVTNQAVNAQTQQNKFRQDFYNQINGLLQALQGIQSADPKCADLIGGWEALLPQLLGVASLATGYTAFGNQAILGSALQIVSSLTSLLQDSHVRSALNSIIQLQNDQILACTYYSIKYAACEYRRAYQLSADAGEIKRLIERRYSSGKVGDYERYFSFVDKVPFYEMIFSSIATMGTPLSLDLTQINNYLTALRIDPANLPKYPGDGASENELASWLLELGNRGITFSSRDLTGNLLPIKDQVRFARDAISFQVQTIASIEKVIREKRSFEDMRHELNAKYPSALKELRLFKEFLSRFAGGDFRSETSPVPELERGAIEAIFDILTKLEDFLTVSRATAPACDPVPPQVKVTPYECYVREINLKGEELFRAMAQGAIAQISSQSVLTLGSKSADRLRRALDVIQNEFVLEDLRADATASESFAEYRKDRALVNQVLSNYVSFRATGVAFKPEFIQTTLESFEKGFGDEIERMVDRALFAKSELVPEIRRKSAPHLCSLFASYFQKRGVPFFGRDMMARCRGLASRLEQVTLIDPEPVRIDFQDPCFYPGYVRKVRMQELLLDRWKQVGRTR